MRRGTLKGMGGLSRLSEVSSYVEEEHSKTRDTGNGSEISSRVCIV